MEPRVNIYKDILDLSLAAARMFQQESVEAIAERGRFLVALSGGSTPTLLYQSLAGKPFCEDIHWGQVHIFWGDERCVPQDDPGNNYFQAKLALLDQVDIPGDNIHCIRSELDPASAALDYAHTLKTFSSPPLDWPRFDLVLLGLGEDGHTASIFPGSPVEVTSPVIVVEANYQKRPARRISLTPSVFNSARRVAFLVSGRGKSKALFSIMKGEYQPERYPAQRIHPSNGEVIWLVDDPAAAGLK